MTNLKNNLMDNFNNFYYLSRAEFFLSSFVCESSATVRVSSRSFAYVSAISIVVLGLPARFSEL
jgi:hypothetical protein